MDEMYIGDSSLGSSYGIRVRSAFYKVKVGDFHCGDLSR